MQNDLFAVKTALHRREEGCCSRAGLLRVGDDGRIVGQPQPLCPGPGRQPSVLQKGAVAVLLRLSKIAVVRVGGITEEQVGALRGLFQPGAGGGVAGEDNAQAFARRSKDLRRLDDLPVFQWDALPPLQQLPLRHRDAQRLGLGGVKTGQPYESADTTHKDLGGYVQYNTFVSNGRSYRYIGQFVSSRYCFDFSADENGTPVMNYYGYGHGVGMSQCGAVGYASEQGMNYKNILKHYYTGVSISTSGSSSGGLFSWLFGLFR